MFQCDENELVEFINQYAGKSNKLLQIKLDSDQNIYTKPYETAIWNKSISFSGLCEGINEFISAIYLNYEFKNIFMKKVTKKTNVDDITTYLQVDMKLISNIVTPWNMGKATIKNEIVWNVLTKMTPYLNNVKGSIYEVLL